MHSTRALGGDGDGGGFRNARERVSAQKATVSQTPFDECAMARMNEQMNEHLIRSFCSFCRAPLTPPPWGARAVAPSTCCASGLCLELRLARGAEAGAQSRVSPTQPPLGFEQLARED